VAVKLPTPTGNPYNLSEKYQSVIRTDVWVNVGNNPIVPPGTFITGVAPLVLGLTEPMYMYTSSAGVVLVPVVQLKSIAELNTTQNNNLSFGFIFDKILIVICYLKVQIYIFAEIILHNAFVILSQGFCYLFSFMEQRYKNA
jgi:hypothetical protein